MFDKTRYISRQQSLVDKLASALKKQGVQFSPMTDDGLENVSFKLGDKTIFMSHHSFYRYSGMINYTMDDPKEKNNVLLVPVTEEMWLMTIILPIVLRRLEIA